MVTWGINPGHSVGISEKLPDPKQFSDEDRKTAERGYDFMGLRAGDEIKGTKIDVAFLGSCTNSRISDLREGARVMEGNKVNPKVKMLVVPGSQQVKAQAEEEGLHEIFLQAGAEWRDAGCSMCLGMNPDKLVGAERSISSSNRNFIGRQGTAIGEPYAPDASRIDVRSDDSRNLVLSVSVRGGRRRGDDLAVLPDLRRQVDQRRDHADGPQQLRDGSDGVPVHACPAPREGWAGSCWCAATATSGRMSSLISFSTCARNPGWSIPP